MLRNLERISIVEFIRRETKAWSEIAKILFPKEEMKTDPKQTETQEEKPKRKIGFDF